MNTTTKPFLNVTRARDMLAMLDGKAPYNTMSNICWGDAYFGMSIEREFGMTIEDLRKKVGTN